MKRSPLKRDTPKAREWADKPRKPLGRTAGLRDAGVRDSAKGRKPRKGLKQGRGMAASPAQQAKVKLQGACLACGRDDVPLDAAHLISRSLGGCSDPDCCIGLCRADHVAYDEGSLDLLPMLEPHYRVEVEHAVGHVGLVRTLEQLTNEKWRSEREAV